MCVCMCARARASAYACVLVRYTVLPFFLKRNVNALRVCVYVCARENERARMYARATVYHLCLIVRYTFLSFSEAKFSCFEGVYVNIYDCMCVGRFVVCTPVCACMPVCIHAYTCVFVYVCVYVCVFVCVCVRVCVYVCVYVCVRVYVNM